MNFDQLIRYAKENMGTNFQIHIGNSLCLDGYFIDAWFGMVKIPYLGDGFIILSRLIENYGYDQCSFEVIK